MGSKGEKDETTQGNTTLQNAVVTRVENRYKTNLDYMLTVPWNVGKLHFSMRVYLFRTFFDILGAMVLYLLKTDFTVKVLRDRPPRY